TFSRMISGKKCRHLNKEEAAIYVEKGEN
ncbi:hypothetical protein AVDCRST_MAG94-1351, partial [uncultured Leptolyngbya sp.]